MRNILRQSRAGERMLGIYVSIPDPAIVELAAYAGFDYIRIDCEHSMMNIQTVASMVRAADASGLAVQVRVASTDDITRLLDFGVQGIVVPDIRNREDALRAVELVKYAPAGARGMASVARSLGYGERPIKEYIKMANEEICLIVQIESAQGLENLDEILSIPGIDMVSSGKLDLSQALGVSGETQHPSVIEAENRIVTTALRYGKMPTLLANSPQRAAEMIKMGICCLTIGYDTKLILTALKKQIEHYR